MSTLSESSPPPKDNISNEYRFVGTLAFEEYLEGHEIMAARRRLLLRGVFLIYGIVIIALHRGHIRFTIAGAALILYATVVSPALFRYRVRKLWNSYPRIHQPMDVRITASGVEMRDDKDQSVHHDWGGFIKVRETEALFLVFFSPLLPLLIPKRLLQSGTTDGLRELFRSIFDDSR